MHTGNFLSLLPEQHIETVVEPLRLTADFGWASEKTNVPSILTISLGNTSPYTLVAHRLSVELVIAVCQSEQRCPLTFWHLLVAVLEPIFHETD